MTELGKYAFYAFPAFALYGCLACIVGIRLDRAAWVRSGERAIYSLVALASVSVIGIVSAMLGDRFDIDLVARASSREQPLLYKLVFWTHSMGAELLWLWILTLVSATAAFSNRRRWEVLGPFGIAFLCANLCFFAVLACLFANPFRELPQALANGFGMSAALRYPTMLLHPAMMHFGLASFAVPFAFAVSALARGRFEGPWLESARRWSLVGWLALGGGIFLGSYWAYEKVGWGGYWSWDAVQNITLLPWLSSTAFLHCILLQEQRGLLRRWNVSLIGITFLACGLVRLITRSDLVFSIHSYGINDETSIALSAYVAVLAIGFIGLLVWRFAKLASDSRVDAFAPRDAGVLLSNYVLATLAVLILVGTLWPPLSGIVGESRVQVGPLFFERWAKPIGVFALLCIAGIFWGGRGHPRRAAGHVVHLSLFILMLGFSGASQDWEAHRRLAPGESWSLGPYTIEYRRTETLSAKDHYGVRSRLGLRVHDEPTAMLLPERLSYLQHGQTWSRPAIYSTWREDLHVIITDVEADQSIALRAVGKPLVQWVWIGGWLLLFGGALLLARQPVGYSSVLTQMPRASERDEAIESALSAVDLADRGTPDPPTGRA